MPPKVIAAWRPEWLQHGALQRGALQRGAQSGCSVTPRVVAAWCL